MRKEQVVLIFTSLLLGWFVYDDLTGAQGMRDSRSTKRLELVEQPVPDLNLALPRERSGRFQRDLFTPPRDTEPLPPLELAEPPLEALEGLAPPATYGPRAKVMGAILRRPVTLTPVPGLFLDAEDSLPDASAGLVNDPTAGVISDSAPDPSTWTPEERAAQVAGYKRLYDSIFTSKEIFGFIRNRDRFGLAQRPDEPIQFDEVDPLTGGPRFGTMGLVTYDRPRVSNFAFADTVANNIELKHRLEFYGQIAPGDLNAAIDFAAHCVHERLQAPRALEIAAELYRKIVAIAGGDIRPQLGLARCFEAGFEFQAAFDIYRELLAGEQARNPVVLARHAALLARFRMFDRAEAGFMEALRWGRSDWEANWLTGRFMLQRGRTAEAIEYLTRAKSSGSGGLDTVPERTAMRTDLGWALLQQGELQAAAAAFANALNLTADFEPALAGQVSVQALEHVGVDAPGGDSSLRLSSAARSADAGFELLHARALADLANNNWPDAVYGFLAASARDPFRADCAYRALSWIAELTGYPEEAYSYSERAFEVDPTDAYTLYQRGRMLAAREDMQGARESFQAAIDRELDFSDALIALGELARRRGEADAAERYFERALGIDPRRPLVHTRRGLNLLTLGRPAEAEEAFTKALAEQPDLASARLGLAWCSYLAGQSGEAQTLYSDLIEVRRNEAEDDDARAYAQAQIDRILEHESKEVWRERFDRRAGTRIGNGWMVDQKNGLDVKLLDGTAVLSGQATTKGRTRLYLELPAARFVSCEFEINIKSGRARVGAFVSRERNSRGEWEVQSEVTLSRSQDGVAGYRIIKRGESDVPHEDLVGAQWPMNQPVRVQVERRGESSDSTIHLSLDGVPVLEDLRVPTLGTTSATLRFGVFVEADSGRSAEVVVDNVAVVRRVQD